MDLTLRVPCHDSRVLFINVVKEFLVGKAVTGVLLEDLNLFLLEIRHDATFLYFLIFFFLPGNGFFFLPVFFIRSLALQAAV